MGQTALLEAQLPLALVATRDVDVKADYEFAVESEFKRLLSLKGRALDPLGHEVWMPRETRYTALYAGRSVDLSIADAECVLLSKALKAPAKNRVLILEYLASGPSERFLTLAKKYRVNLEQFL
ncbi:MAG TPA: hypothetical protein VI072_28005 [Polyangiaceae bacterium]